MNVFLLEYRHKDRSGKHRTERSSNQLSLTVQSNISEENELTK